MNDGLLNINLEWNPPQINTDLSSFFENAKEIMLASVQLNLMEGGRPPFQVKHPNQTPLTGSGRMYAGITGTSDAMSATVYMDSSVVSKTGFFYPKSLNDGAVVPPAEGKLMVFEIDGHTVFTYKRKGYTRQAFPFMIFQEVDKQRIVELLPDAIFREQGEIVQ
jgi:beta-lactamase class A